MYRLAGTEQKLKPGSISNSSITTDLQTKESPALTIFPCYSFNFILYYENGKVAASSILFNFLLYATLLSILLFTDEILYMLHHSSNKFRVRKRRREREKIIFFSSPTLFSSFLHLYLCIPFNSPIYTHTVDSNFEIT